MATKRFPLPKRFNVALSDRAYSALRELNAKYGYGNNYLLTIMLENLDEIAKPKAMQKVFARFAAEYGKPAVGQMKSKG